MASDKPAWSWSRAVEALALVAPFVACAVLVVHHVSVWAGRLLYPYDLEWMEGGMLAHAWRLQQGLPLYVPPSPAFAPFVYPPGFAALVAAVSEVVPMSPTVGRVVALVGLAGASTGAGFLTLRASTSWRAAAFAAAGVVGTYAWAGSFYDVVRADSCFLALWTWSMALALERGRRTAVSAGLLLAAAFVMKHNAATWGLPLTLVVFWRDGWRRAAWFGLCAAVPAALLALRWELASDGLFTTYLLRVPASHPMAPLRWWPGLQHELGYAVPVPLALCVAWVWRRAIDQPVSPVWSVYTPALVGVSLAWFGSVQESEVRDPLPGFTAATSTAFFAMGVVPLVVAVWLVGGRRRGDLVEPAVIGGASLAVAALMRWHSGGFLNVLAPGYVILVIGGAVVLGRLIRAGHGALAAALVVVHVAWVSAALARADLTPTAADRRAGDLMVDALREVDGPVLSPVASWLPTYAGHPPSVHLLALQDLNYPECPLVDDLASVRAAVVDDYWSAVLGSNVPFGFGLHQRYVVTEVFVQPKTRTMFPRTGWRARPEKLMVPPE